MQCNSVFLDLDDSKVTLSDKKKMSLVPLSSVSQAQQMKLRNIRNEPNIRAAMYSDHEISVEEHKQWIDKMKLDKQQMVFVVMDSAGDAIGLVSLNNIDLFHKKADWAFYLENSARGGLGAAIEWHFIEFAFYRMNLQKLNCEVIEGNDIVVRLHQKFSFVSEGFRRSNIIKNSARIGVHFLGLTKFDWLENRDLIFKKHEKVLSSFDIRICLE